MEQYEQTAISAEQEHLDHVGSWDGVVHDVLGDEREGYDREDAEGSPEVKPCEGTLLSGQKAKEGGCFERIFAFHLKWARFAIV